MLQATFFHAGCPVCVSAEDSLLGLIDKSKVQLEVVHLGQEPKKLAQAEALGVQSVPALVLDGNVLHINFGASLADLK